MNTQESIDRDALVKTYSVRDYKYHCVADYHGNRVVAGSFDTIQEMEMYMRGAVYNTQYTNGVVWEYLPGRKPEFQLV